MHPYDAKTGKDEIMKIGHNNYANLSKFNAERSKKFCGEAAVKLASPNILSDDHYDFDGMSRMLSIDNVLRLQQRHDDA